MVIKQQNNIKQVYINKKINLRAFRSLFNEIQNQQYELYVKITNNSLDDNNLSEKKIYEHYYKANTSIEEGPISEYINNYKYDKKYFLMKNYLETLKNEDNLMANYGLKNNLISDDCQILNQHLSLIFKNCDANKIVYTCNESRMFNHVNFKFNDEQTVLVSNQKRNDEYFLIPQLKMYESYKNIVLITKSDYKYVMNQLIGRDYIFIFLDELQYSYYFNDICLKNNQQTTNTIIDNNGLSNIQMQYVALIKIVEQNEYVQVYRCHENELEHLNSFSRYDQIMTMLKVYTHLTYYYNESNILSFLKQINM